MTLRLSRFRPCRPIRGFLLALLSFTGLAAQAGVSVDLISNPLSGGTYQYEFSVSNNLLDDLAIVSITDAPVNDPLIGATLVAPAGFIAQYDPSVGLMFGFVDFVGDTQTFPSGTTIGGFMFESQFSPDQHFRLFEALTVNGDRESGSIRRVVGMPDQSSSAWLATGSFLTLALARRSYRARLLHQTA